MSVTPKIARAEVILIFLAQRKFVLPSKSFCYWVNSSLIEAIDSRLQASSPVTCQRNDNSSRSIAISTWHTTGRAG